MIFSPTKRSFSFGVIFATSAFASTTDFVCVR